MFVPVSGAPTRLLNRPKPLACPHRSFQVGMKGKAKTRLRTRRRKVCSGVGNLVCITRSPSRDAEIMPPLQTGLPDSRQFFWKGQARRFNHHRRPKLYFGNTFEKDHGLQFFFPA
jgi:hypothetical protein